MSKDDLDDPSKTCIYIPPGPAADEEDATVMDVEEEDDGYETRMRAYNSAWQKCLDRVRSILRALNASVVEDVVGRVVGAYDNVLPGLPYSELPVVALYGATSTLLEDIVHGIEDFRPQAEENSTHPCLQVHLYPSECSNVTNMMRALITGFVDRGSGTRRKPTSLASFDINLLRAWHTAQQYQPRLAVFLHEFEKFDVSVVQDALYICSMHIPNLPLVFVLVMASPPTPSYLHSAYPRSTLALLTVQQVLAPTGPATIKGILTKTFFDASFEPDIMLGPGALEYIADFASRHSTSPDTLLTLLQLAHLKHFGNPLSIFAHDNLLGHASARDAERTFEASSVFRSLADALHARLLSSSSDQAYVHASTVGELLNSVTTARTAFRKAARRMRVAFAVARLAEHVAVGDSSNALFSAGSAEGRANRLDSLEMLGSILRGRASSQVRYVCMAVRKLTAPKLYTLVQELHAFLYGLESPAIRRDEEDARLWIVQTLNDCPQDMEAAQDADASGVQDAATKELAKSVGDWLQEYIQERLVRLEECTLWDIWYTGASPFPSELINPAPRPTAIAALLHPHDFIRAHAGLTGSASPMAGVAEDSESEPALWELPDTSIAFRRYVEAGRMVNVFDWFESFAVVLDSQRKHLRKRAAAAAEPTTPSRMNGRGKRGSAQGKGKARVADGDSNHENGDGESSSDESMDEEEEEQWKNEVQARFMRALHELDYMGFVKHTGRKPDHVIRTIYDVPD